MIKESSSMECSPRPSIELASSPAGASGRVTDFYRIRSRSLDLKRPPASSPTEISGRVTDFHRRLLDLKRPPASSPTEISGRVTDFHRRSLDLERQPASQSIGPENLQPDLPSPGNEIIQIQTGPESQQPSLVVVSDRREASANESVSADARKLLEKLGIRSGDEEGDESYAEKAALAQRIADNLDMIEELTKDIKEARQSLVAESSLGLSRIVYPAAYRIDIQIGAWEAARRIAELDSRPSSNMLIETHKMAIRLNNALGKMLINRVAKISLGLSMAAVASISSSVIAGRILPAAVISRSISTQVEALLVDKVSFPLNVILNNVQKAFWDVGVYETETAIEKRYGSHGDETTHQGHNFTTHEFAGFLADPFGNTTIERILAGRLDELTKSGSIIVEWTHNI